MRHTIFIGVILTLCTCRLEAFFNFNDLVVDLNEGYNDQPHFDERPSNSFVCPPRCGKCTYPLRCPPGVRPVTDGCNCCKTCPRQIGEACSAQNVCDKSKNLECDLLTMQCKAGGVKRSCFIDGAIRSHGYTFQPDCDEECRCEDGILACKDLCHEAKQPPAHLRCQAGYYKRVGECCGKWMCDDDVRLDSRHEYYRHDLQANRGHEPAQIHVGFKCLAQTTTWSHCSRSCGVGTSTRINSANKKCKLIKETRNCMIRPCNSKPKKRTKKRKLSSCVKTWRPRHQLHIQVDGCTSVSRYRPRYCRSCPGYCCRPVLSSTKNIRMKFQCPDERGSIFQQFAWTKRCECQPGNCSSNGRARVGIVMGDHQTINAWTVLDVTWHVRNYWGETRQIRRKIICAVSVYNSCWRFTVVEIISFSFALSIFWRTRQVGSRHADYNKDYFANYKVLRALFFLEFSYVKPFFTLSMPVFYGDWKWGCD